MGSAAAEDRAIVSLTVTRFSYPPHAAVINRLLAPLARHSRLGELTPESIARSAFGHFGLELPSDETERERWLGAEFETLIGLLTSSPFPPLGRIQFRATLTSAAVTRIKLERYLASGRPLGQVKNPVFVLGLPRTGTSLMQRLIAEDPRRRGLMTYELQSPVPDENPGPLSALKRRSFGALVALLYRVFVPELLKIHHTSTTSLEECWMLFMSSYSSLVADYMLAHPRFGDHIIADGLTDAYERYRTLLSILMLDHPEQDLVLKSPEHLWFLPALLKTFPDARVIWTHRDPMKALPSYSAQVSLPARQHRGRVEPVEMGQRVLKRFLQGVEVGQRACDDYPDARIVHVRYGDLSSAPCETVVKVYEQLELEVTSEHVRRMTEFLRRPQRDRHQHRYSAAVFGFEEDKVRALFSGYTRRFGIEPELG